MNIKREDQNFEGQFSLDEVRFIHQVLNEVCHGLNVPNFQVRIGDITTAKREMQTLGQVYENAKAQQMGGPIRVILDYDQIQLYRNALQTVCEEIEEWEFETRTGETTKRAMDIHAQLGELLDKPKL